MAADHRIGQVEIFDHRLQFALILFGHSATEDGGDLLRLPDVAIQVQQPLGEFLHRGAAIEDQVIAILHLGDFLTRAGSPDTVEYQQFTATNTTGLNAFPSVPVIIKDPTLANGPFFGTLGIKLMQHTVCINSNDGKVNESVALLRQARSAETVRIKKHVPCCCSCNFN